MNCVHATFTALFLASSLSVSAPAQSQSAQNERQPRNAEVPRSSTQIVKGLSSSSSGPQQAKENSSYGTQSHKVIVPYAIGVPIQ